MERAPTCSVIRPNLGLDSVERAQPRRVQQAQHAIHQYGGKDTHVHNPADIFLLMATPEYTEAPVEWPLSLVF